MKIRIPLLLALAILVGAPAQAGTDFLAEQTVPMTSLRSSEVLDRTVADLKFLFERYRPALDSGSQLLKGPRVTGTADKPILQMTVKKCVAFICQTVDLDAMIQARDVRGPCDRNFVLLADLSRSSQQVSEVYDRLDVNVCYRATADGKGSLFLRASLNQGRNYNTGLVQQEMFKLLKLQVQPIVKALQETLKAKENP